MARISEEDRALIAELRAEGLHAEADNLEAELRSGGGYQSSFDNSLATVQEMIDAGDRNGAVELYDTAAKSFVGELNDSRSMSVAELRRQLQPGTELTLVFRGRPVRPVEYRTVLKSRSVDVVLQKEGSDDVTHLEWPEGGSVRATKDGFAIMDDQGANHLYYLWGHVPKSNFLDFFGVRKTQEDLDREAESKAREIAYKAMVAERVEAKRRAEQEEKDRFGATKLGRFLSTLGPMKAGKMRPVFQKQIRSEGIIYSLDSFMERLVSLGYRVSGWPETAYDDRGNPYVKKVVPVLMHDDGSMYDQFPKVAYDYASWLIANKE